MATQECLHLFHSLMFRKLLPTKALIRKKKINDHPSTCLKEFNEIKSCTSSGRWFQNSGASEHQLRSPSEDLRAGLNGVYNLLKRLRTRTKRAFKVISRIMKSFFKTDS